MNQANEHFGPFQDLWQAQETAPVDAPISRLRTEAELLGASIRKRNRRESMLTYPLAGFFLLVAVVEASAGHALSAAGALLITASMLWVRYAIRRWGRSSLEPEDLGRDAQSFLTLYRHDLERQRGFVLHAWLWYVLPIFAGLLLNSLGTEVQRGASLAEALVSIRCLLMTALAVVVIVLNLRAARSLTQRIVELQAVEHS